MKIDQGKHRGVWGLFFLLSSVLFLSGCLNLSPDEDPTRFYVLSSSQKSVQLNDQTHLAIRSVGLADYVDNSKIVERVNEHEISYLALHRWGGHLDALIGQVVADEIEQSWEGIYATVGVDRRAHWQMDLNVLRFDRLNGGGAEVVFEWILVDGNSKETLLKGRSVSREKSDGPNVEQSVALLESLLRKGVRELVVSLKAL